MMKTLTLAQQRLGDDSFLHEEDGGFSQKCLKCVLLKKTTERKKGIVDSDNSVDSEDHTGSAPPLGLNNKSRRRRR